MPMCVTYSAQRIVAEGHVGNFTTDPKRALLRVTFLDMVRGFWSRVLRKTSSEPSGVP